MVRTISALFVFLLLALPVTAQNRAADIDLNQQAVVETSEGTFVLSFYPDKAPQHVKLFLTLAAEGAYNGTLFHRVIKWGIIQGGDPLSRDPAKKALWSTGGMNKVPAEISDVKHVRGTLSSVIAPGKPNSGGNQFFICVVPLADARRPVLRVRVRFGGDRSHRPHLRKPRRKRTCGEPAGHPESDAAAGAAAAAARLFADHSGGAGEATTPCSKRRWGT